ncbi:MAG: PilN domain-containing protein [Gemmatimonadetes bacterium]|nr:PilN domain-containing protein [Gemmatimonadota bacterium]
MLAWDGQDIAGAVAALRTAHPAPDAIALAIGLGFLEVARVTLPPVDEATREQMVALDAGRYLGANAPLQAMVAPASDVAMGCDEGWLAQVVRAVQEWAPVTRVEATPVAIVASGCPDGHWAVEAGAGEAGTIEVRDGRLAGVRRGTNGDGGALPPLGPLAGTARAAWGALLREDAPAVGTLMDGRARRAADRRRWQGLATAALGAAAGLLFLAAAVDRSRERTLAALDARAAVLADSAAPALAWQAERLMAAREIGSARTLVASRPDPVATLAALSALLPRDVVVTSIRMTGAEWQVEGTARAAAALVPLLDADPRFDQVRSTAASARFRDGRETRESFSITFHVATTN